ncbi:MAG: tetratricopeptide repeat protein [Acidobacteriaceae bacterium]
MNRIARVPVLAAVTVTLLASMTGCKQLEARDQLNKGVEAYKAAQYEAAIDHFQKAVSLDPNYPMTRVYLATAYAQQVVPDLKTPKNEKIAQTAIDQFNQVLEKHPNDVTSLAQIANLYMDLDEFDKAKEWNQKVLAADPKNAQAAYTIGVIDWRQAYKNSIGALKSANLTDDGKGNAKLPKQYCEALKQENTDIVNNGIEYLQKALDINPNYDDAMSYMNLMYRQKANLDCGDPKQREADVQTADSWAAKQLATRRANEMKQNKGNEGIVIQSGK